jgi:hypothetical protein
MDEPHPFEAGKPVVNMKKLRVRRIGNLGLCIRGAVTAIIPPGIILHFALGTETNEQW